CPQRQPEDRQNHEPDAKLKSRHDPKPHVLDERPIDTRPPQGRHPRRPCGHDGEVSEPLKEKEANGEQDNPPSSDGGSLDFFLEGVIHGLPPSSRTWSPTKSAVSA